MESKPIAAAFADRAKTTPILPQSVTSDWYGQAVAAISGREYYIRTADQPDVYAAVNHAQHLSYVFTDRGYAVKNFNEDGSVKDTWRVQLLVAGIGRKGSIATSPLKTSRATGDRSLRFDYGNYALTYNNGSQGMEQRFILNKRPAGKGGLQIEMALTGDLQARVDENDKLLLYKTGDPRAVRLVYDQLKVWDKNKKLLPAHMDLDGNRLLLSVDDRGAVYPLTVDPLNHTPSWNGIGSGMSVNVSVATPMLYGFSVSGAGDVNNDGIKDLIIGAPTYTKIASITITGADLSTATVNFSTGAVGAAFVYYGQNAVMPSTVASKVLQPSGLALGALFGFSVSSTGKIDANNSGVVIGAPGDQVLLNNVLSVPTLYPIGKVFVYSGTTFTTGDVTTVAATPTNTLTLAQADFNSAFLNAGTFLSPLYGFSVSYGGNIKGGTIGSLLVGCPFYPDLTFLALEGRADIYYGTASGLNTTPTKLLGDPSLGKNAFGFSLSSAGDVNGDGFGDIIIGAPGVASLSLAGKAFVYTGRTDASGINTTVATTLSSGASIVQSLFGYSVSGGEDVNGDLKSDVIVGEPLSIDLSLGSPLAAGKAYIYYSGPGAGTGIQTTGFTTLTSPRFGTISGNLLFGFSVAMIGDVTGDNRSEVLVGEPGNQPLVNTLATSLSELPAIYNTTVSGQAYLFASNPSGIIANGAAPYWTLQTAPEAPLIGASLHAAGDVNNDGVPDYLVGAPNAILSLGFDLTLPGGSALSIGTGAGSGIVESGTINNTINSGNAYLFSGIVILPVNLLTFTGQAEGSDVRLNWSTAQEQNSDYFQIERSADNQNFTAIGKVTAAHNSTLQTNYSFTDASPLAGNNYYRLKMVDIDGSSVYSKIVLVSFGNTNQQVIATYPNPAHGSFNLLFKNMTAGRYAMNLINPSGQIIFTRNIQVAETQRYNETISLNPSLAQGTYVVRVVDQQNHTFITRIVIE